jgi:hypothetical protein
MMMNRILQVGWFVICLLWIAIVIYKPVVVYFNLPYSTAIAPRKSWLLYGFSLLVSPICGRYAMTGFILSFVIQWIAVLLGGMVTIRSWSKLSTNVRTLRVGLLLTFIVVTMWLNYKLLEGVELLEVIH